jgi:8-oxo-dGTP pyrophosphatase MutT (NUDIX family)
MEVERQTAEPPPQPKSAFKRVLQAGDSLLMKLGLRAQKAQHPWLYVRRENALAAMHSLVIHRHKGEPYLLLLHTKRPPLGGRSSLELPAGLWGDQDPEEKALTAAIRETEEETGLEVKAATLPVAQLSASPGVTSEMKGFAIVECGEPLKDWTPDESEKDIIQGKVRVPLATFLDPVKFHQWREAQEAQGFIVGIDIVAGQSILSGYRLDQTG